MAVCCAGNRKVRTRGGEEGAWHPVADTLEERRHYQAVFSGGHVCETEWLHQPNTVCRLTHIRAHTHTHNNKAAQSHPQLSAHTFFCQILA